MGANTEAINGESGLQQHAERFHANGAAAARRIEEVENVPAQSTNVEATTSTIRIRKSSMDRTKKTITFW